MASVAARKNKDGEIISYQIKVSRGRDEITGKQLTPYTTTYIPPAGWSRKAIERDLLKVVGEFETACQRGEVCTKQQRKEKAIQEKIENEKKPTFKQYKEIFLKQKKPEISPQTLDSYEWCFKRALPVFGSFKMEDITTNMIRDYINDIRDSENGKPLSFSSVSKHYIMLHTLFETAVDNEIILVNPMKKIKHPKPRIDEIRKETTAYDEKDIRYIMQCLNNEPLKWKAFVMFLMDSGCRRGEAVALKWSEIDLKTGACNICRNAQYARSAGIHIKTPKNGKARQIIINPQVLKVLIDWKRQQQDEFQKRGIAIPFNGDYCFTQHDGKMLNPETPTKYFFRFGEKYNLPGFHPHALRHTMATLSIANGADLVSVSRKLGHSQVSITANIYAHANEEAQKRANEILANVLYQKEA